MLYYLFISFFYLFFLHVDIGLDIFLILLYIIQFTNSQDTGLKIN